MIVFRSKVQPCQAHLHTCMVHMFSWVLRVRLLTFLVWVFNSYNVFVLVLMVTRGVWQRSGKPRCKSCTWSTWNAWRRIWRICRCMSTPRGWVGAEIRSSAYVKLSPGVRRMWSCVSACVKLASCVNSGPCKLRRVTIIWTFYYLFTLITFTGSYTFLFLCVAINNSITIRLGE